MSTSKKSQSDASDLPENLQEARIGTVVDKQSGEYYRRYRQLRGEVRRRIENGALETPGSRAEFFDWFHQRQQELLVGAAGAGLVAAGGHYTAKFVDSAFASGWRQGALALSATGRSVDVPRSMDDVAAQISSTRPSVRNRRASLRSNQRVQLSGLSRDVEDEVTAVVRDSIGQDRSARETVSAINNRVDKVGVTRARRIADYELSDAHNRGAAERYRTRGVREVRVVNPNPCPEICAEKIGPTYSISEAVRGALCPFHPHCRGLIVPA